MSKVSGYFLKLTPQRFTAFVLNEYESFAEPVAEFDHSRNIPLICFILDDKQTITHIGLGRKGQMAGTALRRLNIENIVRLETRLPVFEIINVTDSRVRHHLINSIENGGLIPPKSLEEFLKILLERVPELAPVLEKYTASRRIRIERLSESAQKALAEQKEAVLTAMNIAGIDKSEALGWDYSEKAGPVSFLDGIEKARLREDQMIINDLQQFPGYDLIKTTSFSSCVFENDTNRLTILLSNKLPLEELLGTDLIYYNEDVKCFILVQYKAMEKEGSNTVFRLPNKQLEEEIKRMDDMAKMLATIQATQTPHDYRISNNPFFIKFCPRLNFEPDNAGLSKGIYLPLDYFKMLQIDESTKGKDGGRFISYNNVGRYFDNSDFATIIKGGWIGTFINQSIELEKIIRKVIEEGRTAVLAIKKSIETGTDSSSRNSNESKSDINSADMFGENIPL